MWPAPHWHSVVSIPPFTEVDFDLRLGLFIYSLTRVTSMRVPSVATADYPLIASGTMSHTPFTSWFWRLGHISSAAAPSSHASPITPRPIQGTKCRLSAGRKLFFVRYCYPTVCVCVAVDEHDGRLITGHSYIFPLKVCFVFPLPSPSLSLFLSACQSVCSSGGGGRAAWAQTDVGSAPRGFKAHQSC